MLKKKMLSISIFCLSISIIISAAIITKGMKSNGEYVRSGLADIGSGLNNISANINQYNNGGISKDNYTLFEAATYLKIPENKLRELVSNKGSGIPYVKIENDYIFNKKALEKWLETAKMETQ